MILLLLLLAAGPIQPPVEARACIACLVEVDGVLGRYSLEEWDSLRAGKILIRDEGRVETADGVAGVTRAAGLVPRAPDAVWAVLTDFESWPGFVPLIRDSEVVRREGSRLWVRQRYRVLFRSLGHTTIYDLAPRQGLLRWSLDREREHDIAASEGRWQLVPLPEAAGTLIRYRAAMDAGRAVPDFVENLLRRRSLERLLVKLRQEVERRYPGAGR